jgi:hypothetical protein
MSLYGRNSLILLIGALLSVSGLALAADAGESLAGRGLPSLTVEQQVDLTGSGFEFTNRSFNRYDALGNLIERVLEGDYNSDGVPDSRRITTFTYDSRSNLLQRRERRFDQNDILRRVVDTTFEYDPRGNRIGELRITDTNGDGVPNSITLNAWSYDARGDVVERTLEFDNNADGIADFIARFENSYDARGNLLQGEEIRDSDANGLNDVIIRTIRTFNPRGDVLTETHEVDSGADGSVEEQRTTTFAYDARGRLVLRTFASGFLGHSRYDDRGNLVEGVIGPDDGTGFPRRRTVTTNVYDDQRRLIEQTIVDDPNLDGLPNRIDTFTWTFGLHGNVVVNTFARDITPGDGVPDLVFTRTNEY